MTIIEAIKSRKAFKRPCFRIWCYFDRSAEYPFREKPFCNLTLADILADDWEVREE